MSTTRVESVDDWMSDDDVTVASDDSVVGSGSGSEDEQVSETENLEKQGSDECDCDHLDDIEALYSI